MEEYRAYFNKLLEIISNNDNSIDDNIVYELEYTSEFLSNYTDRNLMDIKHKIDSYLDGLDYNSIKNATDKSRRDQLLELRPGNKDKYYLEDVVSISKADVIKTLRMAYNLNCIRGSLVGGVAAFIFLIPVVSFKISAITIVSTVLIALAILNVYIGLALKIKLAKYDDILEAFDIRTMRLFGLGSSNKVESEIAGYIQYVHSIGKSKTQKRYDRINRCAVWIKYLDEEYKGSDIIDRMRIRELRDKFSGFGVSNGAGFAGNRCRDLYKLLVGIELLWNSIPDLTNTVVGEKVNVCSRSV